MGFDLSKYNDAYNEAETNSFEDPGAGIFQVRFKKIEPKETKAGDPAINILFKIISGEKKGATFFQMLAIIPPRNGKQGTLGIIKSNFQAITFTGNIQQWWERANEWIDTAIEVNRVAGNPDDQGRVNYNVYWKKAPELAVTDGVDVTPPIDGTPF